MASQQLPAPLVINFFIKNTFINIVDSAAQEAEGCGEAEARRCKSAPARMRTSSTDRNPNTPPEEEDRADDAAESREAAYSKETSAEDDRSGPPRRSGVENEGHDNDLAYEEDSESDSGKVCSVEFVSGSTPCARKPDQTTAPPRKIKRSTLLRQAARAEEQFLQEEISRVRGEKWDVLSKGLIELCAQKYSLNAVRIEMRVPCLQLVISKLALVHAARYVGFSPGMVNALKQQGFLREKRKTTEIWATKVDAQQNEQIRLLLRAGKRFQQAFVERQVLVQWTTSCFVAFPFDSIATMTLKQFKTFIAARLGADPRVLDFYSLGNLLEGEDTPLWRRRLAYVVPGALLQMCMRRAGPDEQ